MPRAEEGGKAIQGNGATWGSPSDLRLWVRVCSPTHWYRHETERP